MKTALGEYKEMEFDGVIAELADKHGLGELVAEECDEGALCYSVDVDVPEGKGGSVVEFVNELLHRLGIVAVERRIEENDGTDDCHLLLCDGAPDGFVRYSIAFNHPSVLGLKPGDKNYGLTLAGLEDEVLANG